METDVPMDGNQVSMVGIGISHWRMEAQWRLQYGEFFDVIELRWKCCADLEPLYLGENFDSVAEWRARYA